MGSVMYPEGVSPFRGCVFSDGYLLKQNAVYRQASPPDTTALVRSTAEIFRNSELSQRLPFAPKGVACWYKLFKNSLTEFHIQPDFSLTELNIAIMVIPFNTLFVVITTSPPQNTPPFANLCTVSS